MEALTAASVAALSVYDMIKAVDKHAVICRHQGAGQKRRQERGLDPVQHCRDTAPPAAKRPGRKAGVVIASTRAAAGVYEDDTGPVIIRLARRARLRGRPAMVVPDGEPVGAALRALLTQQPAVIITSGGTGLSPTTTTPEMTAAAAGPRNPGHHGGHPGAPGRAKTPMAVLSRGHAGAAGRTFIVNLPGSPKGVMDGLGVLDPIIGHLCDQLEGHGPWALNSASEVVIRGLSAEPISVDQAIAAVESDDRRGRGQLQRRRPQPRRRQAGGAAELQRPPDAPERVMADVVADRSPSTRRDGHGTARIWAAHRIGMLEIGDPALVCAVAAAHRGQAFAVCSELVDRIKAQVPIWKEQFFTDGTMNGWAEAPPAGSAWTAVQAAWPRR